ncbi:Lipid A ethanolaminephosphotransferase [Candidatus Electronema halotolerans]
MSSTKLVAFASLLFILFYNRSFFQHVLLVYPLSWKNIGFLLSLSLGVTLTIALFITLLASKYTTKPVIILLFVLSSFSIYFMDKYNVVIDYVMIKNILQTDYEETYDLLTLRMLCYFIAFGAVPSIFVYKLRIEKSSLKKSVLFKLRDISVICVVIFLLLFSFSRFYTSFFREHKELRYYVNPIYYVYSFWKYADKEIFVRKKKLVPIGLDAAVEPHEKKKIVIFVVGEAARADHFSLNGYKKITNPLLAKEGVASFSNVSSCGTSTAYSVPCMFSLFSRAEFDSGKGEEYENLLDLLQHTGSVDVLWRDNNSDSKGVAVRVPHQDYKSSALNTICADGECRDEGMLVGLDQYIAQHASNDILIVLHQMGNHGPAYYKRYPKEFAKFTPACLTNELEECSADEIINAYDNALLYTDYFLKKVIDFLKKYDPSHDVALLYFSDHGESLGENGVYLHGIPYIIAPEAQTHIGAVMWFGSHLQKKLDMKELAKHKNKKYSHDNIFHTLLGLFHVQTNLYEKQLDMLVP